MTETHDKGLPRRDEQLVEKLLEMAAFLTPLNKHWGVELKTLAEEFRTDVTLADREAALANVRRFIQSPDKLDSIFVSQIVKREKFMNLKSDLLNRFQHAVDSVKEQK